MQAVAAIAGPHLMGVRWMLMDNPWAAPLYFPASGKGADISIRGGTKHASHPAGIAGSRRSRSTK
jgi:cystathionine beta-lyase/cystathionine gamma-synthase